MACWGFSLFVRLVSETIARRRKRLAAKYSKRAGWIALGMMAACWVVSGVCGYIAVDLAEQFSWSGGRGSGVNSATVIGWTAGLFGVFLVIWWVVGDRARGRVRCPWCWYDMSDATRLQCPECGKTAKSAAMFGKTRRARWVVAVAMVLMGGGWYGVVTGPRIAETKEWLAAVPTWVLMAGWEVWPEEWIYYYQSARNGKKIYRSRLSARIDHQWVSDARILRFSRRLYEPMMSSKEARWDPMRLDLLNSYGNVMMMRGGAFRYPPEWIEVPGDPDRLIFLAAMDLIEALNAPDQNTEATLRVTQSTSSTTPFSMAQYWMHRIAREQVQGDSLNSVDSEVVEAIKSTRIAGALSGLSEMVAVEELARALVANASGSVLNSMSIIAEALEGTERFITNDEAFDTLMSLNLDPVLIEPGQRHSMLAFLTRDLPHDQVDRVFDRYSQWIRSDDPGVRKFGLLALRSFQLNRLLDDSTGHGPYDELIEMIQRTALEDTRKIELGIQGRTSIQHFALMVLVNHDTNGALVYPLLSEFIRTTNAEPPSTNRYAYYRSGREDQRDLGLWIEWFGWIVDSPSFEDRYWLAKNLPNKTGTVHDDQLNELGRRLALDENVSVAKMAIGKLKQRNADHLIPSD